MGRPKEVTRERAATMLQRAVEGSKRLGMDDIAEYYASLSVDEYADQKGLRLINFRMDQQNKSTKRGNKTMSAPAARTKIEIEASEDELLELLDDVWAEVVDITDKSSKEEAAEAADQVCQLLNEYDNERFPIDEGEDSESEADAEEEAA